ncbi:MAG: hypothetical protein Q4C46_04015 [Bacillota bacterium]|nr:hypothetical protein [Bacillota bacterium]
MGFIKFIFALMFLVPVAVLMWFLINKLSADMKDAMKKDAELEKAKAAPEPADSRYSRRYAPGYSRPPEMYGRQAGPYGAGAGGFGSSAAEIRRREQEQTDKEEMHRNQHKELSKRKRRKARKHRKKDREQ